MSVTEHIAAQRTEHGVPHALSCRALGVAESTFYARRGRPPSAAQRRRERLDAAVRECSEASRGTYGSPMLLARLRGEGHKVSKKSKSAIRINDGAAAVRLRRKETPGTLRSVHAAHAECVSAAVSGWLPGLL